MGKNEGEKLDDLDEATTEFLFPKGSKIRKRVIKLGIKKGRVGYSKSTNLSAGAEEAVRVNVENESEKP